jgi:acyl-CoA synthetase (AMP-forming)/AMP-acid ligase II
MMQAGQATAANLVSVRLFNFCGEPLLPEHLEALFAARPDVLVRNTYGPTEATIAVTDLSLRRDDYRLATTTSVAIGAPISNIGIHLIGGRHAEEGQIVITGPQLADGYWRDPAMTEEVFHPIEIGGRPTGAEMGLEADLHTRVSGFIETMIEEELETALSRAMGGGLGLQPQDGQPHQLTPPPPTTYVPQRCQRS